MDSLALSHAVRARAHGIDSMERVPRTPIGRPRVARRIPACDIVDTSLL